MLVAVSNVHGVFVKSTLQTRGTRGKSVRILLEVFKNSYCVFLYDKILFLLFFNVTINLDFLHNPEQLEHVFLVMKLLLITNLNCGQNWS